MLAEIIRESHMMSHEIFRSENIRVSDCLILVCVQVVGSEAAHIFWAFRKAYPNPCFSCRRREVGRETPQGHGVNVHGVGNLVTNRNYNLI